jgi:hypothetical protein
VLTIVSGSIEKVKAEMKQVAKWKTDEIKVVKSRIKSWVALEKKAAASTPPMDRRDIVSLMAESKEYVFTSDQIEEAKRNGVSPRNAWRRVKVLGWSIKDAVSTPLVSLEESLKRAQANNSFRKKNDDYWALIRAKKEMASRT